MFSDPDSLIRHVFTLTVSDTTTADIQKSFIFIAAVDSEDVSSFFSEIYSAT
jgi:hypothetical protein